MSQNNEFVSIAPALRAIVKRRRLKLFGLSFLTVLFATIKWSTSLPSDVNIILKAFMVTLFFLTFGWISMFFWSSLFGFFEIIRNRKVPGIKRVPYSTELTTRTALLMPVYNEDPTNTFANLLAMAEDLHKTGHGKAFDVFVLSDTSNPKVWVQEEIVWMKVKELFPKEVNLFYRHRPKNTARKSGNVEDFCVRWGLNYDYMIVLDADSLMTAETMVKMVQLMQVNETTGIIQATPSLINRTSFFARLQQFAAKVYGPIVANGLAYWQVWDSNYWGHNAIIRMKAFIECCGLPVFAGKAPFGGHILSHDFVEAALIRRHGWLAWLLPDLKGSYEECPPSIVDFAIRDRRWCQGELQHLRILFSKKFHPVSRMHFSIGIMSYLSSPLWFLFLMGGLGIALWRVFFPPAYFTETKTLFPTWPVLDIVGIMILFALSMSMLFLPKILGIAAIFIQRKKSEFGGKKAIFSSLFAEILFSALVAPIMMLFYTKFVFDILMGIDTGWNTQNRSETGTPWKTAIRRHFVHTAIGLGVSIVTYMYVTPLFWWSLPITVGPILSIPISVYSSRESVGLWARKHKLFLTPEEKKKPEIVEMAEQARKRIVHKLPKKFGVDLLYRNPLYGAMHTYLMSVNGPAPDFENRVIREATAKVQGYLSAPEILNLTPEEEKYCLYDTRLIEEISVLMPAAK